MPATPCPPTMSTRSSLPARTPSNLRPDTAAPHTTKHQSRRSPRSTRDSPGSTQTPPPTTPTAPTADCRPPTASPPSLFPSTSRPDPPYPAPAPDSCTTSPSSRGYSSPDQRRHRRHRSPDNAPPHTSPHQDRQLQPSTTDSPHSPPTRTPTDPTAPTVDCPQQPASPPTQQTNKSLVASPVPRPHPIAVRRPRRAARIAPRQRRHRRHRSKARATRPLTTLHLVARHPHVVRRRRPRQIDPARTHRTRRQPRRGRRRRRIRRSADRCCHVGLGSRSATTPTDTHAPHRSAR